MKKIFTILLIVIAIIKVDAVEKFKLDEEQKKALIKLVFSIHPFIDSPHYKKSKETLNHFFTEKIYELLSGNPFIGYTFDQGIIIDEKKIKIDIFKAAPNEVKYKEEFYNVLKNFLKANDIVLTKEKVRYKIGICLVSIVPKKTQESFPGVCLEMYISDSIKNRTFFRIFYSGKLEGLKYAFRDAAIQILLTIKSLGDNNDKNN
jgi:hypothetical protein